MATFKSHCEMVGDAALGAERRAVWWLVDRELVTEEAACEFDETHPDPDLP